MKKYITVILLLLSILMLTACGDIYVQMPEGTTLSLPDGTVASTKTAAATVSAQPTPDPLPVPAVATPAPTPVPTPAPTPVPAETPAPVGAQPVSSTTTVTTTTTTTLPAVPANVYVTKAPYSENVPVGGSCMFISYAANSTSVTWTLVNWNASVIYNLSDGPYYFPGLRVSGQGSSTITLSNVPESMNGWRVQACFTGNNGPVYSDFAYIWTYYPKCVPSYSCCQSCGCSTCNCDCWYCGIPFPPFYG